MLEPVSDATGGTEMGTIDQVRHRSRVLRAILVAVMALALATAACARLNYAESAGAGDGGAADGSPPDAAAPGTPGQEPGGGSGSEPGDDGSNGGGAPGDPGECDETPPADADPDTPVCHDVPPDEQPPDEVPEPSPSPVEPRPGMTGLHPIGWDDASVAGDGRTVTVSFWSGVEPCYVLDHVDVRYGKGTVTITLYEGSDPDAKDTACIEIAQYKSVTITLDEDLGDRKLVDGYEA
jgi:hypothetical protein